MTSQTTTIYTPFADGRTVRDIVEHSPALVNEAWCRDLLRHTLDSLERQYATGTPHRPISPDTIVMLANNEPLLLPAAEEGGPASAPALAADLHALALVVHYAITAELPPDGPLGPRLYDNYSSTLTNGLDRCLGPNMRLRPKTAGDMRAMLGIGAPSGDAPVHASTQAAAPGTPPAPLAPVTSSAAPIGVTPAPAPEPAPAPRLHTPSATAEPLLRTPAAATTTTPGTVGNAAPARPATALESATAARLSEEAARTRATSTPPRATSGSVQRWGWIAGAAIVLLAAGSALVSFLQQSDSREMVALSLPPAERAANGLEPGETVVAPASGAANPAVSGEVAPDAGDLAEPEATPGAPAPGGLPPAASTVPGKPGDAVVNGTTYKLLIKPWGTVYVDGIDRGVSPPVKRLTLGKGLHTIQIVNPNFPDHVLTVDSGSKESTTIEHDFTAKAE
ncbi:MAG: hypothetical protein JWQ80_1261 [Massilia sp.]|nr:hypothetical protein [Massilia sp.]